MADVHTPEQRSRNMSAIRSKNTKPEEIVRKYLFAQGFRYRKNDSRLPGKPDLVLPKYKTVIFVNGCFWHAHEGCIYFVWPKNNEVVWRNKIEGNVTRDNANYEKLQQLGWHILIVWECELKKANKQKTLENLVFNIQNTNLVSVTRGELYESCKTKNR